METFRKNFDEFCNPERGSKNFWKSEKIDYEEFKVIEEISLLDLDSNLQNSTVIQSFIAKHGQDVYQLALRGFYAEVCRICGFDLEDLYFEDFRIFKNQIYFMEIHRLTDITDLH